MKCKTLCELINLRKDDKESGMVFIRGGQEDKFVSNKEMYDKALNLLYELQRRGIKAGDKIILQVETEEEYIETLWACVLGGIPAVTAPLNYTKEHRVMISRLLKKIDNSYVITSSRLLQFTNQNIKEDEDCNSDLKLPQEKIILNDKIEFTGSKGEIADVNEEDVVLIQFSSGSTGNPKGVVIKNKNLMTNIFASYKVASEVSDLYSIPVPDISSLSWIPLTHGMGLVGFHLTPLIAGLKLQCLMEPKMFIENPHSWLEKITKYKPNLTGSPNFGLKHVLGSLDKEKDYNYDLSSVKIIYNGAEPVSLDICNAFLNSMAKYKLQRNVMIPVYGMTEASLGICYPRVGEDLKVYSVDRKSLNIGSKVELKDTTDLKEVCNFVDLGYHIEGCELKICDDNDNEVLEGVVGNILLRGDNVFSTYYNNEPDRKDVFTEDDWFKTGDVGFCINSRLVVTGRKKDIIIVNGCNYYPEDLERLAVRASGIREELIAATSVYSEKTNRDEVLVFLMCDYPLEQFVNIADSIKKIIIKNIGLDVCAVVPIADIPKTNSGKPRRYLLVKQYLNGEFNEIIEKMDELKTTDTDKAADKNVELTETEKNIMDICKEVLEDDSIGLNSNFIEFGGDSLKLTKINARLNELYEDKVSIANIFAYPTIAKLAEFIDSQNDVLVETITLEDKYLNPSNNAKNTDSFVMEDVIEDLNKVAEYVDIELKNILTGLCYYAVSKAADDDEVGLNIMQDNMIALHKINFRDVENIIEVFKKLKENVKKISLQDLSDSRVLMKKNKAAFLLSYNMKTEDMLKEKFPVIINILTENNALKIEYYFNSSKISSELLSEILNVVSEAVNNIIKNFK